MSEPIYHIPDDTEYHNDYMASAPQLWHMPTDIWSKVWEQVKHIELKIAILDTGIVSHPDLPEPIATKSFIPGESVRDGNGHGTHCAGTALGRNGLGVAPGAKLIVGKVLSNGGSGSSAGIAAGIRWAADQGADVISMSLGGGGSDSATNAAIDYAWSKGCIVNAAAGNSGYRGNNTIGWPARYLNCLCTASYQRDGSISSFSSGGREIDWACPGSQIISCSLNGGYTTMSGTSMATPHGSGILAVYKGRLLAEGYSQWKAADAARSLIKKHTKDAGQPGFDVRYGYGIPVVTSMLTDLSHKELTHV